MVITIKIKNNYQLLAELAHIIKYDDYVQEK